MKKLLTLLMACMMLVSVGFAQANQAPKKVQQTTTVKVKKDGTPDKRYKGNKAKAPVVVLKKDGTPDKRYKAKPVKKS